MGCKAHVEELLSNVAEVQQASVNLQEAEATLVVKKTIPITQLNKVFEQKGGRYSVHPIGEVVAEKEAVTEPEQLEGAVYYCPMHCEGDKVYPGFGDCPVCGMDLVPQAMTGGVEDSTGDLLIRKFWLALAFTLPIFIIAMGDMIPGNPLTGLLNEKVWSWIQFGLSLPVVFYAAWMFFERAYRSLRTWNLNMFTLIGIGAGVAWIFSTAGLLFPDAFPEQFRTTSGNVHLYFEASTVILTLVLLGQVLEARAHRRTSMAIKALMKLAPNTAYRVVNGEEEEVPLEELRSGDLLRVKPGNKIPVDGHLTEGNAVIDESMITGEPLPVDKSIGTKVHGGTLNGNTTFLMRADKVGADTLLAQIITLVNQASMSRAPIQKLADRVSGYFVPIVVGVALITFILWVLFGPEPAYVYGFVNAIAVLIIACPCALGLATPMSVMVGMGKGAQNGVLFGDAEALEKLNEIDTLVIDKTGTLTEGKPAVENVLSLHKDHDEEQILRSMASLSKYSEHPLSEAIVQFTSKQNHLNPVEAFEELPGKGLSGTMDQRQVLLGNRRLMEDYGIKVAVEIAKKTEAYQKKGKTISYLAIGQDIVGFVAIGDPIKATSLEAIKKLQHSGLEVIMLTGDSAATAASVARELEITRFETDLLPEAKLEWVKNLQKKGKRVAVAGDGINDAPALAVADVGIAMGTGTDVAIETAGVTLVKGDLTGLVKAKVLSKKVMGNIRQNLFFAMIYNTLGVPIAAGVLYPFFGILLSPMIAALAMSFSSVSVIANALRLRRVSLS